MILIAGQAGVGKSTLAGFIAEEAFKKGLTPVLLSFASPLKEEAKRMGYGKEVNPKKYREYCQEIGAARREEDPDYWVKQFDTYIKEIEDTENKAVKEDAKFWERVVIVDDARYLNELAYGKVYNAATVFISAKDREDLDLDDEFRNHESEELARCVDSGQGGHIVRTFTNIIFNEDGIEGLRDVAKELTPAWCGLTAETYCDEKDICTCGKCEGSLDVPKLEDIIENLIDLLFLSDPEKEKEEEEEDDNDLFS